MAATPAKKTVVAKRDDADEEVDAVEVLAAEGEPSTFDVRDETFTLRDQLPGIIMLRLSAAADPKTPQPKQMNAMLQFVEHAVVAEDQDRFNELLLEADPSIEIDEMSKIVETMIEAVAARPT